MSNFTLQTMQPDQWPEVASLIHDSTNAWYRANRNFDIFTEGPESTLLFCEVYESLDPGCCLVAVEDDSKRVLGSCFYHPRETHFSLGIMNVHPDAFGRGVARTMLGRIMELAESENKPVRLVSSAMNLDSYSLYTKAGFVPRETYQDMILEIPDSGIGTSNLHVRDATIDDVEAIMELERRVAHITREKDYRHFIANESGQWHTSVLYDDDELAGWIVSISHPASSMIGPCIARDEQSAIALLQAEINHRAGNTMVFLVPVEASQIVRAAYGWGAKNCELHVSQVYGEFKPFNGIVMPTFMPETA
ncbi:GNAT family N-acetyltransferase [Mariniblastus fucicola]|uniref:N-acetyltransferase domain-containing protein n=1 Tax=Mariniblastus fucicola TaxID=980251 RepID=A0A5B9P304_9BACT|nr:GNAT family N-acetyltransferase [Mariniblastus fucicola]QEG20748.1 hypothetical protein MFFC18_05990 [Mariniblastus fucicola]